MSAPLSAANVARPYGLVSAADVAELVKAHPEWSNRRLAAALGIHHSRVAPERAALVARGEIPAVSVRACAGGRLVNTDHPGNTSRPSRVNSGADLSGRRFGRLVVIGMAERNGRYIKWLCRCDCGQEFATRTGNLTNDHTHSCGCYASEMRTQATRTHGLSRSRAHMAWLNMRQRCSNPRRREWKHYGGRGITVCERWQTFENFYADMGDPPAGHSLDRIDVEGNYEPGNCRWASATTQARNTRSNRNYTFEGRTLTLTEWSHELGINYSTLHGRVARSSFEDAVRAIRGASCRI